MERRKKAKEIPRPTTWPETAAMWFGIVVCFAVYHLWLRKALRRKW
jgi:hypothetical protein